MSKPVVFVSGYTCTGKSTLINKVRDNYRDSYDVLVLDKSPSSVKWTEDSFEKVEFKDGSFINFIKSDISAVLAKEGVDNLNLARESNCSLIISDRSILDLGAYLILKDYLKHTTGMSADTRYFIRDVLVDIVSENSVYLSSIHLFITASGDKWYNILSNKRSDNQFIKMNSPNRVLNLFFTAYDEMINILNNEFNCDIRWIARINNFNGFDNIFPHVISDIDSHIKNCSHVKKIL